MRAYIAVFLLAVSVYASAQTIDPIQNIYNQAVLKNKYTGVGSSDWLNQQQQYPAVGIKNYWPTYNTQYTLEEIIRHPLFPQYYSLPLFRQHFTHPLFQAYLTTQHFQQYWIYTQFQNFFRNPYLFYKYVYPVVYSINAPTTNPWDWDSTTYGNNPIRTQYQPQIPLVYPQVDNRWTTGRPQVVSPFNYFPTTNDQTNYASVLDRTFRNQFLTRPEVTEVKTDVKILKPTNQADQETVTKVVDPITGEIKYTIGDSKNVEDRVFRVPVEDWSRFGLVGKQELNTVAPEDDFTKDAILKKIYLNKFEQYGVDNVGKYDEKVKEQLNQAPPTILSRTRRHAVYTQPQTYTNQQQTYSYNKSPVAYTQPQSYTNQQQTYSYNKSPVVYTQPQTYTNQQQTYSYNKNARSLYYTVPLTHHHGISPYTTTYAAPSTYIVPTTYAQPQYHYAHTQPTWYYPTQGLYV